MSTLGGNKSLTGKNSRLHLGNLPRNLPHDICLVDIQSPIDPNLIPKNCIGLTRDSNEAHIFRTALLSRITHIVQVTHNETEKEIKISAALIQSPETLFTNTVQCILGESIKPIKDIHGKESSILKYSVLAKEGKHPLLAHLKSSLNEIRGTNTVRESILCIADELYTNALFNAPTGREGQGQKFAHIPRNSEITLSQNEAAELFIAHNESQILVGCRDPFGTLVPDKVLVRLLSLYSDGIGASSINLGRGGAGIGFQMMFQHSNSMYIGVNPNRETVVICVLPLRKNLRETEGMSKNLHLVRLD